MQLSQPPAGPIPGVHGRPARMQEARAQEAVVQLHHHLRHRRPAGEIVAFIT